MASQETNSFENGNKTNCGLNYLSYRINTSLFRHFKIQRDLIFMLHKLKVRPENQNSIIHHFPVTIQDSRSRRWARQEIFSITTTAHFVFDTHIVTAHRVKKPIRSTPSVSLSGFTRSAPSSERPGLIFTYKQTKSCLKQILN